MHTNKTTYYELPQYIGSDIIDPLVDTNGAYAAIDTAIHNVAEDVATETTDIANLKAQNGSETLTTTAQTLSGAVNELDDDLNNATTGAFALIGTNSADIATINGEIGDANSGMIKDIGQLQTTVSAQGLSITSLEGTVGNAESGLVKDVATIQLDISALQGSVVTLEGTVGDANSGLVKDVNDLKQINKVIASVRGDGVKTVTQLLADLWNEVKNNLADIPREAVVVINQSGSEDIFKITSIQSGVIIATYTYYSESSNWVATYDIRISATPTYKRVGVSDSAFNIFDYAATVYTDTTSISIIA